MRIHFFLFLLLVWFLLSFSASTAEAQLGMCYGTVASNLPPPPIVAAFLQARGIYEVRIFKPEREILRSFKDSRINFMVGVPNEMLPSLANNTVDYSLQWLQDDILSYIPHTQIKYLAVGNEIFLKDPYYTPFLVPAILNLHQALGILNLDHTIKLSTPHASSVLESSFPPSNGTFNVTLLANMIPLLEFLRETDSPFMVNVYPFISYINNPNDIGLDYALFQTPNKIMDNGLSYGSLFDATLDAYVAAMERVGYGDVQLLVSETGWPTAGAEMATPENARAYVDTVARRVAAYTGTPRRPGVGFEVYLFDMFDEDEKEGEEYEKHFGVFRLNGERAYDVSLN